MTDELNHIELKVNSKIYPLETIYSAAYVFLDKAYILLDGDPESEVIVKLTPKYDMDAGILSKEFFNELLNYADYKKRAQDSKKIREMLLQRAIITNEPPVLDEEGDFEEILKELEDDGTIEEDIAVPWEDKNEDNS